MATDLITRPEDLKPGDIFLGPIGGLVGLGVGAGELLVDGGLRVGTVDVRHAGIVVEPSTTLPPGSTWRGQLYETGVITAPRLVQAMPGGAEEVDISWSRHWTDRCLFARLPEDYQGQAQDAAFVARAMVDAGVAYSPLSYLALSAWRLHVATPRLEAWIGRRQPLIPGMPSGRQALYGLPCEAICSVLVDQAWSLTGKRIFNDDRPHQCVTPSQLGQRLIKDDQVIKAWPGFLRTQL